MVSEVQPAPDDFGLSPRDIVVKNGFRFDKHSVTTKDGYILTLFRIRDKATKPGAPVVYFQHGITDTAVCWIIHSADKAPAFVMASLGYDVWLGNFRGNTYSSDHEFLQTDSKEYWDFSF